MLVTHGFGPKEPPLMAIPPQCFRLSLFQPQAAASKKGAAKVGNPKPLPALKRAHVPEPDSSDEEEERLLALGQQGK